MKLCEIVSRQGVDNTKLYKQAKKQLYRQYPELSVGGGIGLCAFASGKLKELLSGRVELELIIGKALSDNPETTEMFDVAKRQWASIPPTDIRYEVAQYFLSHNKKKTAIGHCVCYDGKTIIDITSEQFGVPMFYSLDEFEDMFDKIERDVEVRIDNIEDFGII